MYTGDGKSYETKIFTTRVKGAAVAFSFCGVQDYSLMAIQDCQTAILKRASKPQSMDELQDLIRIALRRLFKEHTEMQPDDVIELLIGAWTQSDGLRLLSTRRAAVFERKEYECKGSGSALARYLIGATYKEHMGLRDVIIHATQVLAEVKSHDEYCGGQSELVVLDANGSLFPIAPEEISYSEEYIGGYDKWARRFMFDFGNPQMTDEDFSKRLDSFVETIKIGRDKWKEDQRAFQALETLLKAKGLTK
jgi:hypothetical protein